MMSLALDAAQQPEPPTKPALMQIVDPGLVVVESKPKRTRRVNADKPNLIGAKWLHHLNLTFICERCWSLASCSQRLS